MLEKYKKELNKKGELYILCKVFPNSDNTKIKGLKKDNIDGRDQELFLVSISASPEKNKANKELVKLLSGEFNVYKENIVIISGSKDRLKLIKIKK
jgi:uncharacterized protein (TIGR00251 family)